MGIVKRRAMLQEIDFFAMDTHRDIHKLEAPWSCIQGGERTKEGHLTSAPSRSFPEIQEGTAPLTIFYNGNVAVFDVHPDMADIIIKLSEKGGSTPAAKRVTYINPLVGENQKPPEHHQRNGWLLVEKFRAGEDLPLARTRSLLRFLEKRKERLTCCAPYNSTASSSAREEVADNSTGKPLPKPRRPLQHKGKRLVAPLPTAV